MLSKFLEGAGAHTPSSIVKEWYQNPIGSPHPEHAEHQKMFSVAEPFETIKYARPALTSFAAQLVEAHLLSSADKMVSPEGGLHTSRLEAHTSSHDSDSEMENSEDQTIMSTTQNLLQNGFPLLWHYCTSVASPKRRQRLSRAKKAPLDTQAVSRNYRPPEIVATHAISSILFSRNRSANLLSADKGLLLFACAANRYLFDHESRIGASTAYSTVLDSLDHYAKLDAAAVIKIASSEDESGLLRFDNMQKQIKARHERLGRESSMLIGCAGTYCKAEGLTKDALSLEKKHEWLEKNLREKLTFEQLWDLVDYEFLSKALPLQWLDILFDYAGDIPQVRTYSSKLRNLYEEFGTKMRVSPRKTQVYPLKSNGYNETTTSELLKALQDFIVQLGQSPDLPTFSKRLILAGGDGLSYERMVQLKNYLQFLDNEYERMDILEPFLESWHTLWTNLSRIYEAHWVGLTSADPSSLGFGANTLKRKAPGNVSKVDYYRYSDILDSQVEARVLDIWSNDLGTKDLFNDLETMSKTGQFPTFDNLYKRALYLHRKFGSLNAYRTLMLGRSGYKEGSRWQAPKKDIQSNVTYHMGTSMDSILRFFVLQLLI
ncbi:hypothetical protein BDP27DRAFT_1246394 [Rhodocollybia butyracea]|uniref:DUF6589 domain-containing protein n=1 Tax=Rhodocollybia butyracea TaxID=206335 RepID=A0A9P5TW52_9AGAR|nr:hypothetical protein BDP27DRAFT_1246394 [Rhodocollybia butyracea]